MVECGVSKRCSWLAELHGLFASGGSQKSACFFKAAPGTLALQTACAVQPQYRSDQCRRNLYSIGRNSANPVYTACDQGILSRHGHSPTQRSPNCTKLHTAVQRVPLKSVQEADRCANTETVTEMPGLSKCLESSAEVRPPPKRAKLHSMPHRMLCKRTVQKASRFADTQNLTKMTDAVWKIRRKSDLHQIARSFTICLAMCFVCVCCKWFQAFLPRKLTRRWFVI